MNVIGQMHKFPISISHIFSYKPIYIVELIFLIFIQI